MLKQLVELERKCWKNVQYSRWECTEIVGIPDNAREKLVWELVVTINPDALEACHHLPSVSNNNHFAVF